MIIDIGSGPHPKSDADIRMDVHQWGNVNCLHNLFDIPYPLESDFFDKAYMGDVIEHIPIFEIDAVMQEVNRILKPNGILEVTMPDADWIFERIVNKDWKEKANADWLNPTDSPWDNALSYLFGGFHNQTEYKIPGMGHVTAYNKDSLIRLLTKNGFVDCVRVDDERNPKPASDSILKLMCKKK